MNRTPKLAVFDIDGTIATAGIVHPKAIAGIQHLQKLGCITTLSTGRSYIRLRDVLGDVFRQVVSPDALLMVEHGTKIVDRDGTMVFGEIFSEAEIEHVVDFVRANVGLFQFVRFAPSESVGKLSLWCVEQKDVQATTIKTGHYADVFSGSIGEFHAMLRQHTLTNISCKLRDFVTVQNLKLSLTRSATNLLFQDGYMEFVKNNSNKGLSVGYVARKEGVKMADTLIAGNAINDVEMLDMGAGTSILVNMGSERTTILSYVSNPSDIYSVESPEQLGEYLLSLR
jgi:HAD superfamily hydrolase (TIGR01484 family)